jgi:Tfp pilus assembly protein PilV
MRTRSHRQARGTGERGFTLAETAIALLMMMIASVSVVSLFTYAIKYNAGARDRELSMAVAQKRMEWLRGIPYNSTNRALAYHYPDTANPASGGLAKTADTGASETVTVGGRDYTVVTIISNVDNADNALAKIKKLSIQVTPKGANTAFGRVTLVTQRSIVATGSN